VLGLALFGYGARLNWHTDRYLSRLRQRSKGYQIPVGGWFDWISAPHYFGEILQWTGFWIACGNRNKAAASFAIYTASNLIPRGVAHHVWYRQHFGDKYPSNRRAVIPFLW
jgi:steroid 5-alpha reductase family enzyme